MKTPRLIALTALITLSLSACATSDQAAQVAHEAQQQQVLDAFHAHNATALTRCETEDQTGCMWVADEQGNLSGQSFWTDTNGHGFHYSHDDARLILRDGIEADVTPLGSIHVTN